MHDLGEDSGFNQRMHTWLHESLKEGPWNPYQPERKPQEMVVTRCYDKPRGSDNPRGIRRSRSAGGPGCGVVRLRPRRFRKPTGVGNPGDFEVKTLLSRYERELRADSEGQSSWSKRLRSPPPKVPPTGAGYCSSPSNQPISSDWNEYPIGASSDNPTPNICENTTVCVPNHKTQSAETISQAEHDDGRNDSSSISRTAIIKEDHDRNSESGTYSDSDDENEPFTALPSKRLSQLFFGEGLASSGERARVMGHGARSLNKGKGIDTPRQPGDVSNSTSGQTQNRGKSNKKRKRLNAEDTGEDEDEDDNRDIKRDKPQTAWPPQFCPEFLANISHEDYAPGPPKGKRHKTCAWRHISMMPQHMKRYHTMPEQCGDCGFRGDAGQVRYHKERSTCEPTKEFVPVPAEDKEKVRLLGQKRNPSWEEIFRIQNGSGVAKFPEAIRYVACLAASLDFARSFIAHLRPLWPSIIEAYYKSPLYEAFAEKHKEIYFGPDNSSRSKSEMEKFFVESFLCPSRDIQTLGSPGLQGYPNPSSTTSFGKEGISSSPEITSDSPQISDSPQSAPQPAALPCNTGIRSHLAAQTLYESAHTDACSGSQSPPIPQESPEDTTLFGYGSSPVNAGPTNSEQSRSFRRYGGQQFVEHSSQIGHPQHISTADPIPRTFENNYFLLPSTDIEYPQSSRDLIPDGGPQQVSLPFSGSTGYIDNVSGDNLLEDYYLISQANFTQSQGVLSVPKGDLLEDWAFM